MTKRFLLVLVVALAISMMSVGAAYANFGPHGGYVDDTDSCAGCHRAHTSFSEPLVVVALVVSAVSVVSFVLVELRASDGVTVLATSASEKSLEEIEWTAETPTELVVRVHGVEGATNAYTLLVDESSSVGCQSDGLGDNAAAADAVLLFQGVYEGFHACGAAADWFAVDLNGGETLSVLKDFNGKRGHAHLEFLFEIFVRNTVIMAFEGHVVIDAHPGILPPGEFIGAFRQGEEGRLVQLFEELRA